MNKQLIFGFVLLAFCSVGSLATDWNKTLAAHSKRLNEWVNSVNVSHSTAFYLFNVTPNATDPAGIPLTFAQVGPFRFKQEREINTIGYVDHQRNLVFSMRKYYHYIDEGADLNQKITLLNIPLMVSHE